MKLTIKDKCINCGSNEVFNCTMSGGYRCFNCGRKRKRSQIVYNTSMEINVISIL